MLSFKARASDAPGVITAAYVSAGRGREGGNERRVLVPSLAARQAAAHAGAGRRAQAEEESGRQTCRGPQRLLNVQPPPPLRTPRSCAQTSRTRATRTFRRSVRGPGWGILIPARA
jgi:hypothetical protein